MGIPDNSKYNVTRGSRVVDEHFWFTATTLAVNGYLISAKASFVSLDGQVLKAASIVVSAFAIFLVVDRSATGWRHALQDRLSWPVELHHHWRPLQMCLWSLWRVLLVIAWIPIVVLELGSSLLYIMLILLSCVGVIAVY